MEEITQVNGVWDLILKIVLLLAGTGSIWGIYLKGQQAYRLRKLDLNIDKSEKNEALILEMQQTLATINSVHQDKIDTLTRCKQDMAIELATLKQSKLSLKRTLKQGVVMLQFSLPEEYREMISNWLLILEE